MKTLGVDLASQPASTAIAVLTWAPAAATVEVLELGATDERIIAVAMDSQVVGIDAPFGWPIPFTGFLSDNAELGAWTDAYRDRLRFRRTDFAVRAVLGRWPLSVSSELIAVPAMRCQRLLRCLDVEDRSGDGRVFEVYPALGLHRWGLPSSAYKGTKGRAARASLWEALRDRAPWLGVSSQQGELMRGNDDALDAVLAAMIARAAMLGAVEPIPAQDRAAARAEGWIVIPTIGALDALCAR